MADHKKEQSKKREGANATGIEEKSGEQMKRSSQKEKSGVRAIGGA